MSRSTLLIAALAWSAALAMGWATYMPGMSGVFLLDDVPNLSGLAGVEGVASAVNFILSGEAGPLGRPLALATFVPQADAWEHSAVPFLSVNILIHLTNATLLWCVLYRLLDGRCRQTGERLFIAGAGAVLWMSMP
ncbi:MAG TPA: hypothetical protein VE175_00780, partial [Woeseiaceae bacterium]|nr:hypothetical protein [Woeseiaceae bacterium]